jgi:hypothetical protein
MLSFILAWVLEGCQPDRIAAAVSFVPGRSAMTLVLAQVQTAPVKNYWADVLLVLVFFGLALFTVCRTSRRL